MTIWQKLASEKYRAGAVFGDGPWARISTCQPTTRVCLYPTREDAERMEAIKQSCGLFCKGPHRIEELDDDSVRDIAPWAR